MPAPPNLRSPDPDRARGALLGLAVGDALGTTVEFQPPGTFPPVTDMVGGGPFELRAGQWTDDTSMALCLAESLIERGGFDPCDQMERYVRWWREGRWSSTGRCFDIGYTTATALSRFERTGEPYAGPTAPNTAGNGSLMRLAPVAIAYARDPVEAVRRAGDSSRTTHGAREAVDACRWFASLLVAAIRGAPKDALLDPDLQIAPGLWDNEPLVATIREVACGSFRRKAPPEIHGTGHVVRTLEAALWAFATTDDFGGGAVYGQIAGAHYGAAGIPERWLQRLHLREEIDAFAHRLLADAT